LVSPGNGASVTTKQPTFDWTDSTGATSYNIQARKGSTIGTVAFYATTTISQYQPTTPLAGGGTKYYWCVRACTGTSCSAWTGYWWFKVTATTYLDGWNRDDWMLEFPAVTNQRIE
jgi:hypothetical protein